MYTINRKGVLHCDVELDLNKDIYTWTEETGDISALHIPIDEELKRLMLDIDRLKRKREALKAEKARQKRTRSTGYRTRVKRARINNQGTIRQTSHVSSCL